MKIDKTLDELLVNKDNLKAIKPNFVSALSENQIAAQKQTADAFSNKWKQYDYNSTLFEGMDKLQKARYLKLYGFSDETALASYLKNCQYVLDAGAGMCYKSAWFAKLSPSTVIIASEISDSIVAAVDQYDKLKNLFFVRCDISSMSFFHEGLFDYVSCDQVIHHTANPFKTFQELVRVTGLQKELSVYVYRKKALPRELIDDYFRKLSKELSHAEILELSRQLTELGRVLSSLDTKIDFPNIPALGIEGGEMSIQRFIYWNFLKCYWNEAAGYQGSLMTNYDWYSPSLAFRYSEQEFKGWIEAEQLTEVYFHSEKACFSGRFFKTNEQKGLSNI